MHFRFLAGVLAAGGILWGLLSVGAIGINGFSLIFIPGYIITLGYIIRCVYTPRLLWRRMLWGASALVQGAWLIFYFGTLVYGALRYAVGSRSSDSGSSDSIIGDVVNPFTFWWIFALAISIYGYRSDKGPAAQPPKD